MDQCGLTGIPAPGETEVKNQGKGEGAGGHYRKTPGREEVRQIDSAQTGVGHRKNLEQCCTDRYRPE